jgi:hypothetical protein
MQGDTKLFHNAFKAAGFRPAPMADPIVVFNDKHKSGETRRLKLLDGDGVFQAPQFIQEALEQSLKNVFGDRYLGGQFIARTQWWAWWRKSFVIYLLEV